MLCFYKTKKANLNCHNSVHILSSKCTYWQMRARGVLEILLYHYMNFSNQLLPLNLPGLTAYSTCAGALDQDGGNDAESWDCGIGGLLSSDDSHQLWRIVIDPLVFTGCREGDMDPLDCEAGRLDLHRALILGELFSILVDSSAPEGFSVFLGLPHFVITMATKILKETTTATATRRIFPIFPMSVGASLSTTRVGIIDDLVSFVTIEFFSWCFNVMLERGVGFVSLSVDLVDLICFLHGVDRTLHLCL